MPSLPLQISVCLFRAFAQYVGHCTQCFFLSFLYSLVSFSGVITKPQARCLGLAKSVRYTGSRVSKSSDAPVLGLATAEAEGLLDGPWLGWLDVDLLLVGWPDLEGSFRLDGLFAPGQPEGPHQCCGRLDLARDGREAPNAALQGLAEGSFKVTGTQAVI